MKPLAGHKKGYKKGAMDAFAYQEEYLNYQEDLAKYQKEKIEELEELLMSVAKTTHRSKELCVWYNKALIKEIEE